MVRIGTIVAEMTGSPSLAVPVEGSSQLWIVPLTRSSPPRTSDPTARMIIGTVMSAGDSCGWASWTQRRLLRKVMKYSRDM